MGIRDFVVFIVRLDEVLQDRAGLEHVEGSIREGGVGYGGDAAVGVDFEEPGLFLGVLGEGVGVDFVGEGELFETDGGFDAVGGVDCVEGYGGGGHCGVFYWEELFEDGGCDWFGKESLDGFEHEWIDFKTDIKEAQW